MYTEKIIPHLLNLAGVSTSSKYLNQINKSFKNHWNYPSLKSLTDTFDEWQIPSIALKISLEQLSDINYPAIAHCNSPSGEKYILIKDFQNNTITYFENEKEVIIKSVDDFSKIWSGIVLLVTPEVNSEKINLREIYKNELIQRIENYISFFSALCIVLSGLWLSIGILNGVFFISLLIGLITSILLLQNEFGKSSGFILQFCKLNAQTDCNKVLKSSSAKLFNWLSWAEIGFLYFSGITLTYMTSLFTTNSESIYAVLLLLSFLSLPYTFYSIYYQALIVKKWCTLCLVVQGILWVNFLLQIQYLSYIPLIETKSIYIIFLVFLLPILFWFILKPFLIKSKQLLDSQKEASYYYRNSEIFTSFLEKQRNVDQVMLPGEVTIGNINCELEILIISNVFCKPCALAHKELDSLINFYGEDVKLKLRFITDGNPESEMSIVTKHILSLNHTIQSIALSEWFSTMDYVKWSEKYPVDLLPNVNQLLDSQNSWSEAVKIIQTPTIFVNGRELAAPYSYNYLKYHLRHLIETNAYV